MATLHSLLVFLHLLGMATLVGGFSAQLRASERRVTPGQWHGALLSLISGVWLVGLAEMGLAGDPEVSHAKVALKLGIALAITLLAFRGRQRREWRRGWLAVGGLALLNTAIAVFVP